MDKPTLVAAIIANASTQFTEADKEALMAMDESVLNKMLPVEADNEAAVANAATEAANKALNQNQETTDNTEEPQTAQQYIDKAPDDVKAMLQNGMNSYAADKAKLIKIITANDKNTFTDKQLQAKQIEELKSLAELAANTKEQVAEVKQFDFSGQADPVENVDNADTPLPLPSLGLAPKEATAAA